MIEFLALTFRALLAIFAALGLGVLAISAGVMADEAGMLGIAYAVAAMAGLIMFVGLGAVLVRIMDLLEEIRDGQAKR